MIDLQTGEILPSDSLEKVVVMKLLVSRGAVPPSVVCKVTVKDLHHEDRSSFLFGNRFDHFIFYQTLISYILRTS